MCGLVLVGDINVVVDPKAKKAQDKAKKPAKEKPITVDRAAKVQVLLEGGGLGYTRVGVLRAIHQYLGRSGRVVELSAPSLLRAEARAEYEGGKDKGKGEGKAA